MRLFLLSVAFLLLSNATYSQNQPNLGFEYNNLSIWNCFRDNSFTLPSNVGGVNTTTQDLYNGTTYYVPGAGVKTKYIRVTSQNQKNDPYGNYPVVCPLPGAGKHSVKLGTDSVNNTTFGYYGASTAQGITYDIQIPANNQKFKIVYYYAIDLENPGSHTCDEMPYFQVEAFDANDGTIVAPCANFGLNICDAMNNDTANWGSWHKSTVLHDVYKDGLELDTIYYMNWTPATIIAQNMGGHTITMRFTSAGCTPGAHFGYAYVDFDTTAMQMSGGGDTLRYCPHDTCFNFTPPPGYRTYEVYDSVKSPFTGLDTSINLATITPTVSNPTIPLCGLNLPKPKTWLKVVLTPNVGFGCIDTLYYFIDTFPGRALDPIISPRDSICSRIPTTLTNSATGGQWVSLNNSIATINGTKGIFTGIMNGLDTIGYYANNKYGCADTIYKSLFVVAHSVLPIAGKNGVCIGDTIHLSDSAISLLSGTGVWSIDNTSFATIDQSGIVTGIKYGTVNVKYIYINQLGCTDTVTKSIQVGIPPLPAITGVNVVCANHTTLLQNATPGGSWSSTNTAIASVDVSGNVLGLTAGIDTIKYTISFGGCSDMVKYPVTVNAPVITLIKGDSTVCQKHAILLTNASAGGTWESLNNKIATIDNAGNVTPGLVAGKDTIRYILPVSNGCYDSVFTIITVNAAPKVAPIKQATGTASSCFGVPASFSDDTTGGAWFSTDPAIFTVSSLGSINYVGNGTASVRYIVTTAAGCKDSVSSGFTVNPVPVVGKISGKDSVCTGSTAILNESTTGGVWSSSNTLVATISGSTVSGIKGGTAVIKYQVTAAGCTDSATFKFTVVDYPVVAAIAGDSILCLGHTSNYTNTASGGVWSVLDPTIATISNGVVTPVKLGSTSIKYKISNAPGCADSARYSIRVNDFSMKLSYAPKPVYQNNMVSIMLDSLSTSDYSITAWTPSSLFSNQTATTQSFKAIDTVYVCATGMSNKGNCVYSTCDSIIVLPISTDLFVPNVIKINANNPANSQAKVRSTATLKSLEFKVFNQWGEVVFSTNDISGAWDGKANGTIQPVGVYVYVVKATTLDNKIINKKGSITLVK